MTEPLDLLAAAIRELKEKADKYDETQKPDGEFVLVPRASYNALTDLLKPVPEQKPFAVPAPSPWILVGSRVRWAARGDSGFGTVLEIGNGLNAGAVRVQCDAGAGTHWFLPDCLTLAVTHLPPATTPSTGHAERWTDWLADRRERGEVKLADRIADRVNSLMLHMPHDWSFDQAMHWAFTRAVRMTRLLDGLYVPRTPFETKEET